MHLCFVDESGTPAKPDREKPRFFVIAGLVIPEDRWRKCSDKLNGLKRQLQYRGELKWRFFAPANDDADNPMREWQVQQRNHFREQAFKIITSDRSIQIVAGVSEAKSAYSLRGVDKPNDIYFRTYKVVTERFQYLLQDITRTSGRTTHGIIVADHRGKGDDEAMRTQHHRLVETDGQFTSNYANLIEGLFLTPSHMSIGIQLADLVAGAVWRRFESNDSYWFDQISGSFRQARDGTIDGWGIARFPKYGWQGPIVER